MVTEAKDFFALLEKLCVFMSASKAHMLYFEEQKTLGYEQEVCLKKLSETHWSCRHSSIKAISSTIEAVLSTLKKIVEGCDRSKAIEASGLLTQVKSF